MDSNILKTTYLILLLCFYGRIDAQYATKVIVTDVSNEQLKLKMADNASKLLTEINMAFFEKRELKFDRSIISSTAISSLLAMWEMSTFRCYEQNIIEKAIQYKDSYEVRNIPVFMKEASEGENYEETLLVFNKEGVIDNFYISIGTNRFDDILRSNDLTDFRRKQVILHFVENFRTAYYKKDLKFLEHVFSDDSFLKIDKSTHKSIHQMIHLSTTNSTTEKVRNLRLSKMYYINGFKRVFNRNEYINMRFDEISVVKHIKYPEIYGVTIKQEWKTKNYNDAGYVFLMIDFKDDDNPIIHVRTWQPEKFADGTILSKDEVFRLANFSINR